MQNESGKPETTPGRSVLYHHGVPIRMGDQGIYEHAGDEFELRRAKWLADTGRALTALAKKWGLA